MYSNVEEGKTRNVILIHSVILFLQCPLVRVLFFKPHVLFINVSPSISDSLFLPLPFVHTLLFPHTGSLIQVPMSEKGKITRGRLGSLSLKKEGERQCFLFSKHLIICTRGSGGKLHLTKVGMLS